MKKLFLIPLLTLMCSVMAWGATRTAGTFQQLQDALEAAAAGDVIELTADITYPTNGVGIININKSITLDGKGHTIWGLGKAQLNTSGSGQNHYAVIAVNENQFGSTAQLNVTIKNLSLGNISKTEKNTNGDPKAIINARCYGIVAYDGVKYLTLENDSIKTGLVYQSNKWQGPSNQQPICLTGTQSEAIVLTINNSFISSGNGAYPFYILKPITATLTNVTTEGWCALYFKYRNSGSGAYAVYGPQVAGSRGSVVTANNCAFNAPNIHEGESNGFAVFPIEDDGITLNLNNCSMNAERFTSQAQMVFSLQYQSRPTNDENFAPVIVNINGDNTHLYNVELNRFALSGWNTNDDDHPNDYTPYYKNAPLHMNITGGTYTIDPSKIKFRNWNNEGTEVVWENAYIDPSVYEVKEVSQGGNTVYRVVKKAATHEDPENPGQQILYNLNDAVETTAEGENPVTSFELSTGGTMELDVDREVTTAGYVQVKDNGSSVGTVVKVGTTTTNPSTSEEEKVNQVLVVNNGLDVQGNSKVEVQPGSTLQIGEGGIVTAKPENIVIGADENGAASLIMDPAITVNQTPKLTVKMTAKQIGRNSVGDFYWHRYAMPVAHIENWKKEGNLVAADPEYKVQYPTYVYAWDYDNNDWKNIAPSAMDPLQGYTLTLASDYIHVNGDGKVVSEGTDGGNLNVLQDVTYTFEGNLVGNTNQPLNFQHEGFNFFGNSYTGYMDVKTALQGLEDNHVDGTAYMWCNDPTNDAYQTYVGISLYRLINQSIHLESWQKEVAPMQTFILRLRGADSADESIDYASAIWGNPRYGNSSAAGAPRRRVVAVSDDTYLEIVVKAANGKGSSVDFTETANNSDAFESGYDVEKYMNEKTINLYATVEGVNLSSVVTNNIAGKTLSLKTNDEITYTLSFKNVDDNAYAVRDNATNKVIAIEEGASYEFAAQPNSTVEGRFEIVDRANVVTSIDNAEDNKAKAKGIYTIMGQYVGENFDVLPTGVYVVDGVKIVK